MEIRIDNKIAALKEGESFEYVSENRLFSGSDDYTLSITFPLKNCATNIEIFGNIQRADVLKNRVHFDCEIRDKGFYKFGTLAITEISEKEVKTQFLEGRSEQNFDDTFDDIYINTLDLGAPEIINSSETTPQQVWEVNDEAVALPWINDSDDANMQNKISYEDGVYSWHEDCTRLSWQPYLLFIAKKICEAVGYTYDFSDWENSKYRYLLCCNTLPAAWYVPDYARALPHWTVAEFFEKLELLMQCEFDINHRLKKVSFSFSSDVIDAIEPVLIENIVDEYSADVKEKDDTDCDYIGAKNVVYKECSHDMWRFYSCDWFIRDVKDAGYMLKEYDTLQEIIDILLPFKTVTSMSRRNAPYQYLYYAKDVDTYFVLHAGYSVEDKSFTIYEDEHTVYKKFCFLQPVNPFGGHIVDDSDDADETEVEFVPVRLDSTDETYGRTMFLEVASYSETDDNDDDGVLSQPEPVLLLQDGEKDKKSEYYSVIYVGFWDGTMLVNGKVPYPILDKLEITEEWNVIETDYSLRLANLFDPTFEGSPYRFDIDPTQKFTFKFLSDSIPNVRAVFHINGKRYICEKLTATFTENGMSQLIKFEGYRIV